ncbi:MAG TPA: alpha/beta hydrolase-fold protein [Kofleriaceae bacterium]|nr:alpha/beta hydrolase-fold protein [Kofleriaceae bacterium]
MKLAILVLVAACTEPRAGSAPAAPCPPAAVTTPGTRPYVIGETFDLDSKVLGERRVINVYLPPDYTSGATYPVLYMPDGGFKEDFHQITGLVDVSTKNEVIRPMIVVGIENTERRRDLTGPTDVPDELKAAPHAGGSDKFRQFLRDELKPQIRARYHATDESALIGESLAGLFVIETLLVEPALFDTFIAVDPSVWWHRQAAVKTAATRFASWSLPPKRVFITTGDLPEMQQGVAVLMAAYREHAPAGLAIRYEPMPAEHHNTIYPVSALRALRTLFARP